MKKIILSLAIVLTLFSTAFANHPVRIYERAAASFHKDFHKASDVKWAVKENYVVAKFIQDNQTLFAYYDYQGNMIGLLQHILTSSLPANLQKDIKKRYGNYWVSELFKLTSDNGVYYYIQLKNADETIVLSNEGTYGWHRYAVPKNTVTNL